MDKPLIFDLQFVALRFLSIKFNLCIQIVLIMTEISRSQGSWASFQKIHVDRILPRGHLICFAGEGGKDFWNAIKIVFYFIESLLIN